MEEEIQRYPVLLRKNNLDFKKQVVLHSRKKQNKALVKAHIQSFIEQT